jgi:hypothetical protein
LKPHVLSFAVLAALLPLSSPVRAESTMDRAQFFVSQRLWQADWDISAVDMRLVPPSGTQPALLRDAGAAHVRASRMMPLTGLGVALDRWTLSATVGWSTKYSDARLDAPAGRSEYDINLGYGVTPNISAVVVYKAGKTDIPAVAGGPNPGAFRDEQRLRGGGLGVSARYPFAENWSAYGSAAYSVGRSKLSKSKERLHARYTVAEAGVGYRLPGAWANVSLTAGYRYQEVDFRDGPRYSFALTPEPAVVGRSSQRIQSATKGFTAGVAYSF